MCARKKDTADPSSDKHKNLQNNKCVTENCEWHSQGNAIVEAECLNRAQAIFNKLYAEYGEEKNPA